MGFYDFNMNNVKDLELEKKVVTEKQYDEEYSYLPLACKKMWFKRNFPLGVIRYPVVEETDAYAKVEARVYANNTDPDEAYIGVGFATTLLDEIRPNVFLNDVQRKSDMVAYAKGLAASRALAEAGFGLQFYKASEDPEFQKYQKKNVDLSSIPTEQQPDAENSTTEKTDTATEVPKKKRGRKPKNQNGDEATCKSQTEEKSESMEELSTEVEKCENEPPTEPAEENITEAVPDESDRIDPDKIIADVGMYAGTSISEIARTNINVVFWLIQNSKNEDVVAASRKICKADPNIVAKANRQGVLL